MNAETIVEHVWEKCDPVDVVHNEPANPNLEETVVATFNSKPPEQVLSQIIADSNQWRIVVSDQTAKFIHT